MSKKEQWMFLNKLGKLMDATIPIEDALRIATRNIKNKKLLKDTEKLLLGVMTGKSLGNIFYERIELWGQSTVALVTVGELSGTLAQNLLRASDNMKNQEERKARMLAALFYPILISILALGIIIFLLAYVYPKITPLFLGMNTELPVSTRIIIQGSRLIGMYWMWVLGVTVVSIGGLYYSFFKFNKVRIFTEHIILSLPLIGNLIVLDQLCQSSFIIGSLCQGGMNIADAIETSRKSVEFVTLQDSFKEIHFKVVSGTALSESLSHQKIFPPLWVDMVSIGEKVGSLPGVLINISELHRQDIDERIALVNKLIEPLMMILVGGVVGFIALSIITPMYSLTQHVQGT